jgi:hypothetical protein
MATMQRHARSTKGFAELGAGIGAPGGRSVTAAWRYRICVYVAVGRRLEEESGVSFCGD